MKVTAFLEYDLYPYYLVTEGDLQEDFSLKASHGTYAFKSVICVKPIGEW